MTLFILLAGVAPLIVLMLFAEPLTRWLQRLGHRLWGLAARMERYIEEHGEHTMTWPEKIRFTRDEWHKTE